MISLDIKDYCQTCPEFKPVIGTTIWQNNQAVERTVVCGCREICENILRHRMDEERKKA